MQIATTLITSRTATCDRASLPRRGVHPSMHPTHYPYGIDQLEPKLTRCGKTGRIRCPVQGCRHWLKPPTRKPKFAGDVCLDHGIVVHGSGTYTYADYRQNLLIDADYFERHVRRHPFKYEAHRFGSECSEDAVTWAVFRSLQNAGCLAEVIKLCTGLMPSREPRLLLWGLELKPDGVEPWDLLIAAREQFESDLPVERPKTEPDIALYVPGEVLVLIEAKFTSKNPTYQRDRTKLLDLTIGQLIQIYQWPQMRLLDAAAAGKRDAIHYQLWRNLVFADYMAGRDSLATRGHVANLVRDGCEADVCEPMLTLMPTAYRDRFEQVSWEQLYAIARRRGIDGLCRYMLNKTARLKQAFKLGIRPHSRADSRSGR